MSPQNDFTRFKNERGEYRWWLHLYTQKQGALFSENAIRHFLAPWVFDFEPDCGMLDAVFRLTRFKGYPAAWSEYYWYSKAAWSEDRWYNKIATGNARDPIYWVLSTGVSAESMVQAISARGRKLFYDPNRRIDDAKIISSDDSAA